MSAEYKATALNAVEYINTEGTLREQAEYVYDQLQAAHPQIAWGVGTVKITEAEWENTAFMFCSVNASQILCLFVGDDLLFRIFAHKLKADETALAELAKSSETLIEELKTQH